MRPIKFKAQRVSDGEWVEGSYIRLVVYGVMKHFILPANGLMFDDVLLKDILIEIDPNTLCQFTGLVDIDRVEVYEHDIIMTEICLMVVVYVATSASFGAVPLKQFNELSDKSNISTDDMYWFDNDIVDLGLYGNIHDKTGER